MSNGLGFWSLVLEVNGRERGPANMPGMERAMRDELRDNW